MTEAGSELSEKICSNCVLSDKFPGIVFDDKGICNYCRDFNGKRDQQAKKAEYSKKFDSIIEQCKGKFTYDALMCYSGGKDSTFTLALLKEKYGLNVLAVTFDNGFLPNQTFENIRTVVDKLGVDLVYQKPRLDVLTKIFRYCASNDIYSAKSLERASGICTSCMGILRYTVLRLAIEKNIPLIVYGWTPGQAPITSSIMRNNQQMVRNMQKTLFEPLFQIAGKDIVPYFLEERHFTEAYRFPYNVHPLAFFDYSEETIYKDISRFGWKIPEGVDSNSTNCLLNSFADSIHKQKFGFHPYAYEMAGLVRQGYIDRATALEKLNRQEDPATVEMVKRKLGL